MPAFASITFCCDILELPGQGSNLNLLATSQPLVYLPLLWMLALLVGLGINRMALGTRVNDNSDSEVY